MNSRPGFTPLLAIKEASRCLLCHDAPCSQASARRKTDWGNLFVLFTSQFLKAQRKTIRKYRAWRRLRQSLSDGKYASADVHVPE